LQRAVCFDSIFFEESEFVLKGFFLMMQLLVGRQWKLIASPQPVQFELLAQLSLIMQKLVVVLLSVAGLCLAFWASAAETNPVETNQVSSGIAGTNAAHRPSDPELQAAAQEVWHKIILFGVLGLVGGIVVTGFAVYGAYRKFGIPGAIIVGIVVVFGVVALGGFLLIL